MAKNQLNGPIKHSIHSYPPSSPKINSNQPARGQRRGFLCSDTHTHCTAAAGRIRLGSDTPSLPFRRSDRSLRAGGTKLIFLRWGMRKRWYDLACSYCFATSRWWIGAPDAEWRNKGGMQGRGQCEGEVRAVPLVGDGIGVALLWWGDRCTRMSNWWPVNWSDL